MAKSFFGLKRKIGIDLGTSRTRIWVPQLGIELDQPSCVAVNIKSRRIVAIGEDALQMRGRSDQKTEVIFPLSMGEVQDLDLTQVMLQHLIKKAVPRGLFSPTIAMSVPSCITPVQKEVRTDLANSLGAQEIFFVSQSLAAAVGSEVPIGDASGAFIFHLGAGIAEVSAISLGSEVVSLSSTAAGEVWDNKILQELKREHHLLIGLEEAEKIKKEVVNVAGEKTHQVTIMGKDLGTNSPKELRVQTEMLSGITNKFATKYTRLLAGVLKKMPPELTGDILDKGLLLSGGLAKLTGLEEMITTTFKIPTALVEEPDLAVAMGLGKVLDHLDEFKNSLGYEGG